MKEDVGFTSEVLAIDSPLEASRFFERYVALIERGHSPARPAQEIARHNIGYCFGEGMSKERRAMWREACGASHPYLGDMVEDPDPKAVFAAGFEAGLRERLSDVFDEIAAERAAQIAKGRDAAVELPFESRHNTEWILRVDEVIRKGCAAPRRMWIKIASIAVAAVEAIDRRPR